MKEQLIISAFALLTAIANIFSIIINSRKLEKIKKSLDLKGTKLQRLWEMKEKISKLKMSIDLNDIKLGSTDNIPEKLNSYVSEHRSMFVNATDIYFVNKSFFDKSVQDDVSSKVELIRSMDEEVVENIIKVKENKENNINHIMELKSKIIDESISGYRIINTAIEKEIEKLERELMLL